MDLRKKEKRRISLQPWATNSHSKAIVNFRSSSFITPGRHTNWCFCFVSYARELKFIYCKLVDIFFAEASLFVVSPLNRVAAAEAEAEATLFNGFGRLTWSISCPLHYIWMVVVAVAHVNKFMNEWIATRNIKWDHFSNRTNLCSAVCRAAWCGDSGYSENPHDASYR